MQSIIDSIIKLSNKEERITKELLDCLFENNSKLPKEIREKRPSYIAFQNSNKWGGKIENSLASALITLNTEHGPFSDAFSILELYFEKGFDFFLESVIFKLSRNEKISGFGNPVIKKLDKRCESIKSKFKEIDEDSYYEYLKIGDKICNLIFNKCGKNIEPNVVYWNVSVMHYLGYPKSHASLMFILAIQIKYINSLWLPLQD